MNLIKEEIDMLKLLLDSVVYSRENDKKKITVLEDIKPSSFRFVITEAIGILNELLENGEQYEK